MGGGPVGLFLGICLQQSGIDFVILERRNEPRSHSRSLGIHPVSLELFEKTGIIEAFLQEGIKIEKGVAFSDSAKLGSIPFRYGPGPYRFVLSIPQYRTEQLLREALAKVGGTVLTGSELTGLDIREDGIELKYHDSDNDHQMELQADFVVGADGKNSLVRSEAGFKFEGGSYSDTYIMGDFTDNTVFESDAAVFLTQSGVIECFPLSETHRRWVVKTESYITDPTRSDIEKRVAVRIGHDLGEQENTMLSSFGVQRYLADPIADGRILLAGDAAHVISPIGGQGMNLGWLDAWDLARTLDHIYHKNDAKADIRDRVKRYGMRRQKAARNAIRRAEFNMKLGRAKRIPLFRNVLIWVMLNTPLRRLMVRLFTMRGIEKGWF